MTSLSRSEPIEREKGVEYVFADLHDESAIFPVFQKADAVINASGMVSYHKKHTHALKMSNVEALRKIGKVLHKSPNIQHFLHISSCAAFGCQPGVFTENTPSEWEKNEHHFPYSHSKYLGDEVVRLFPVPVSILYPPLILGPEDTRVLPSLFLYTKKSPILFSPKGKNGIIDVRDFARAVALVLASGKCEEYIVTEKTYSFLDVIKTIIRVRNVHKPIISLPHFLGEILVPTFRIFESFGLPLRSENAFFGFCPREPNGQKIRDELGFVPRCSLEQTVRDFKNKKKEE